VIRSTGTTIVREISVSARDSAHAREIVEHEGMVAEKAPPLTHPTFADVFHSRLAELAVLNPPSLYCYAHSHHKISLVIGREHIGWKT
jgi:hypothetical protein